MSVVFDLGIGVLEKLARQKIEAQSMQLSFVLTIGKLRFLIKKTLITIENQ